MKIVTKALYFQNASTITSLKTTPDVVDELDEVRADPSEHEVGDLLFAAVQVARRLDHDPEAALRGAVGRFELRFREVERLAESDGSAIDEASEEMLVVWWNQAKHDVG